MKKTIIGTVRLRFNTVRLCFVCGLLCVLAAGCGSAPSAQEIDAAAQAEAASREAAQKARVNSATPVTLDEAVLAVVSLVEDKIVSETPADAEPPAIAVLQIDTSWPRLSAWINDELAAEFSNSGKLKVVDKQNLQSVRSEQLEQRGGNVSDEMAAELGKEIGAKYVVLGTMYQEAGDFRLRIYVTGVATGQRILTPSRYIVQTDRMLKPHLDAERAQKELADRRIREEQEKIRRAEDQQRIEEEARRLAEIEKMRLEAAQHQAEQTRIAEQRAAEKARIAWKENYLYFGARGGAAIQIPKMSEDDFEPELHDTSVTAGPQFAGFLSIQPGDYFALQVEAIYQKETIEYSGYDIAHNHGAYDASFEQTSLMIPLLLKINGRPGNWMFSLFGGFYYTLPLSKTRYTSDPANIDEEYEYSVPIGWTAGLEVGLKLGPGVLFLDARYAGDIGATSIEDANGKAQAVFQRRMVMVTLGYELGLFGGRNYYEDW